MSNLQHPKPEPRPELALGSLRLTSRYLLSPLAGFTNLSFRRVVREIGGLGLATTDLVNARGLLTGNEKTLQLTASCEADRPLAVQIFGHEPDIMAEAARLLEERGVDSVDINMGCPVNRITQGGAGASLMCQTDQAVRLVRRVVEAVRIPVTVKMRLGWDRDQLTAPGFAREFEHAGVAAVMIHGRTREQGFSGTVDLDGIRQVVKAVQNIPVIGNGDVLTIPDADRMLQQTGCQGVSIGRGALANPWLFRQLVEWEQTGAWSPSGGFEQRLELLRKQYAYMAEQLGDERAITAFRKMGHWYLKAMRVRASLRHRFQLARTPEEQAIVVEEIRQAGPVKGPHGTELPDWQIPVPSGPVERW